MILCAAGDIHGGIDRMYAGVLALEAALNVRFDWVLHVGDFGVWPNPGRIDAATRRVLDALGVQGITAPGAGNRSAKG